MDETRATVSVEEAARILGISRGLAYEMVHQGKMPVLRFGRRMVVPKKAIEKLLVESEILPANKGKQVAEAKGPPAAIPRVKLPG